MNTDYQMAAQTFVGRKARKRSGPSPLAFLVVWVLLIGTGIYGAVWYTEKIKANLTEEIGRQTSSQIAGMQKDYEARVVAIETQYKDDISKLQGKVDALNELLEFSKDNASSTTDSNKLYTQLREVKKQLNELKKSLDVLK